MQHHSDQVGPVLQARPVHTCSSVLQINALRKCRQNARQVPCAVVDVMQLPVCCNSAPPLWSVNSTVYSMSVRTLCSNTSCSTSGQGTLGKPRWPTGLCSHAAAVPHLALLAASQHLPCTWHYSNPSTTLSS
jgi:hypothetical protein